MTTECKAPQKAARSPPKISHKAPGDLTQGYTGQWGPRDEGVVMRLVHGRQGGTDAGRVPSSLTGSAQAPVCPVSEQHRWRRFCPGACTRSKGRAELLAAYGMRTFGI